MKKINLSGPYLMKVHCINYRWNILFKIVFNFNSDTEWSIEVPSQNAMTPPQNKNELFKLFCSSEWINDI